MLAANITWLLALIVCSIGFILGIIVAIMYAVNKKMQNRQQGLILMIASVILMMGGILISVAHLLSPIH
jgi:DMSO reductase anchor subunit